MLVEKGGAKGARTVASWQPVYLGLKDAVLSHRVQPGTKLPEDELTAIYSVSRTIVRAALQALAHDNLVRLEPNRGAFVAHPSRREAREVFEARALIEPHVARLAAEVAGEEDVAGLTQHLEREHAALKAGEDSEAIKLSALFHVSIAEIAGQSILTEYVRDLVSRSSLIVALYWKRRDATCESHAHHALVDAIARNRPSDAAELMTSHLVDLLSGLDLSLGDKQALKLADILK